MASSGNPHTKDLSDPCRDSMFRMLPSRWLLLLLLLPLELPFVGAADLTVSLRSRVEAFKGSGEWRSVSLEQSLPVGETAVLICDMWDKHWCRGATERVNSLVPKMAPFLESARKRGIQIIHAPSETMAFYQDAPQRKRILAVAKIDPPPPLNLFDPPLPIDDQPGGGDTPHHFHTALPPPHPPSPIDPPALFSPTAAAIHSF